MTQCSGCKATNKPGARFCQNCGKALSGGLQTIALGGMVQGRYQVLRLLGQGGMGAVYQVLDTRLAGKLLAMKEMLDAGLSDPADKAAAVDSFRKEAELLAKLDHPNIPKVSDAFSEGGKHYIVMELVQGETLEERLDRLGKPCSEQEVRAWAEQLCDVLAYLHGQQPPVIFRDLKPGNIMITPQGQVKLIDFGIARFFKSGKVGDTVAMGTVGYAAPEQFGQKQQTDARSDIYSLGVVLHAALTLHDPASTQFKLPPVSQRNQAVSSNMERIIIRATQLDANKRYQSASELRQDLLALAGKVQHPSPVAPASSVSPPQPPQTRLSPWAVLAVLVILLGGGGALAYQMLPTPVPTPTIASIVATTPTARTPTPTPGAPGRRTPQPPPTVPPTTVIDPTAPPATRPPRAQTATPIRTATADWRVEAEQAVIEVVRRYGDDIKVEALTFLIPDRLPEIFIGDLLERQRRGVCGLRNAGQYYTYSNRSFTVQDVLFENSLHARLLAEIREDRVLHFPDRTPMSYLNEIYRAAYFLQQEPDRRWYINCFFILPDDSKQALSDITCTVEVPAQDTCKEQE